MYLMDLFENNTVEITASGSKYCFKSSSFNEVDSRFKIIATFKDLDVNTDTNSVETKHPGISVFNSGNIILIKNHSSLNGFLFLFDIAGRLIQKSPFHANGITTLKTKMSTGLYLVKAVTLDNEITKNILVQE